MADFQQGENPLTTKFEGILKNYETLPAGGGVPSEAAPASGSSDLTQKFEGILKNFTAQPPATAAPVLTEATSALAVPDQVPQVSADVTPAASPQATPTPVSPAIESPPSPERQPSAMGGFRELPEAIAPAPGGQSEGPGLARRAFEEVGRFAASANKPVLDVVHGFARMLEEGLNLPYRAISGDWKGETPHTITAVTGSAQEIFAPQQLQDEAHPVTKFMGNLLGGLESYMLPGRVLGAGGVTLPHANLFQKFGSNLLTFATTDVSTAVGQGGGLQEARDALVHSIPTAALFTVAQVIPFDKLSQNPWLVKAMESTATGGAFAGSHALQGETDPAALAVSFLTGFGLHAITSGMPAKGMSLENKEARRQGVIKEATDNYYNQFTIDWRKENNVSDEQWPAVKEILDKVEAGRTPQPTSLNPAEKYQAIFGELGPTIEDQANRADAVRALVPLIGDQARAERFVDLYEKGDADTALKEFPEISSLATEQQKAVQPQPGQGGTLPPEFGGPVPVEPKPVLPQGPMGTSGSMKTPAAAEVATKEVGGDKVTPEVTPPDQPMGITGMKTAPTPTPPATENVAPGPSGEVGKTELGQMQQDLTQKRIIKGIGAGTYYKVFHEDGTFFSWMTRPQFKELLANSEPAPANAPGPTEIAPEKMPEAFVGGTQGTETPPVKGKRSKLPQAAAPTTPEEFSKLYGTSGGGKPEGLLSGRDSFKEAKALGDKDIAYTADNQEVPFQWAVVELGDLVASHDNNFNKNPEYHEDLQPRDRTRAASEISVGEIINKFNPSRLGQNPMTSDGAIIVGPDMAVESGNGRTIALRKMAENAKLGPQEGGGFAAYRKWLESHAEQNLTGISKEAIEGMKEPVLVRIRTNDLDMPARVQLAEDMNMSTTAAMSPVEKARRDSQKLMQGDILTLLQASESGEVNLDSAANDKFVKVASTRLFNPSERGAYFDSKGKINTVGINRIRTALFAGAYGEGSGALDRMAESTNDAVKNITNAMLNQAPRVMKVNAEIEKGHLPELSISRELAEAVDVLDDIRLNWKALDTPSGKVLSPIEHFLAQKNMFGIDPLVTRFIEIFRDHGRSTKKLANILNNYYDVLENLSDRRQGTLLDDPVLSVTTPTKSEMLEAAVTRMEADHGVSKSKPADVSEAKPTRGGKGPRGDAGPPAETKYSVKERPEESLTLSSGAPKPSQVITRLNELQADYPGIDREKASAVLRTFPKAETDQIANMVADPEMFSRMVRSELSAAEQNKLGGALPGRQQDLFGAGEMGKPGGGRLFSLKEAKELAPVFFSQMANHLEAKLPGKGSGADLAKIVEGWAQKGQFKADELKWSGLLPWLREQKGPVTKQQVANFLKENQVGVREVVKEERINEYDLFRKYAESQGLRGEEVEAEWEGAGPFYESFMATNPKLNLSGVEPSGPKFQGYLTDLPESFTNRREMLLTVPGGKSDKLLAEFDRLRGDFEDRHKDAADTLQTVGVSRDEAYKILRGLTDRDTQATWLKVAKNHLPRYDWQPYLEAFEKSDAVSRKEKVAREQEFRVPSGHAYGDPAADVNRFAHVFTADYVDPKTGKKNLVVTELQSDWAREGRSKGYKGLTELPEGYTVREVVPGKFSARTPDDKPIPYGMEGLKSSPEEATAAALKELNDGAVSSLPFSKNWHEVALKQAIRFAAENGYDGVMVVNGEMVKQRYDLSKKISKLETNTIPQSDVEENALVRIRALDHSGKVVINEMVPPSKVGDYVGKELAEKINAKWGTQEFSGLDLQVGGTWANNLYDKTIPSYLKKYVKQWGAEVSGKDVETFLEKFIDEQGFPRTEKNLTESLASFPITPAMQDSVLYRGQPQYKSGETLTPKVEAQIARGLTTEQIQSRLGENGTVSEVNMEADTRGMQKYNRGWLMRLKNDQMAFIFESKDGSLSIGPKESLGPDYAALGRTELGPTGYIAGSFRPIGLGGVIELARGEGPRTFDHESWHFIEHWLLNDKERAAVIKKYGDNEELRAQAYENWNPKEAPDTIFQKIQDFFKTIVKAITGHTSAEDVFAAARSGEMFGREPVERKLPEALAPTQYSVKGAVTEKAQEAKDWYGRVSENLGKLFNAPRLSEEALKTHQSIVKSQAEADTEIKRMAKEFTLYAEKMGGIHEAATQEFCRLYQSGQLAQITDPTFKAFGEFFRKEEQRQMEVMKDLGKAPKELANYLDQLWERDDQLKAVQNAIMTGRSMRGPNYFFNARSIPDIPTGIAMGLKPKFDSLPEMAMAGRAARERFIAAQKRINDLETNGYQRVVKNLDNIPEGWRQLPGGYGEVWARVERRAGQMVPEVADENALPMGGGPGRAGYEEVPGFKGWTRVGYRVAPDYVVTQFENFLGKGLRGNDLYHLYQGSIDSIRTFQMALSWFHATFESLNAMSTTAGRGMMDAMGGLFTGDVRRMGEGLKALGTSPIAPLMDIQAGRQMNKRLLNPEGVDPQTLAVDRILVGGGQRIEAETKLTRNLATYFREAWSLKGSHPVQATGKVMRALTAPVMDFIVPFAKMGSTRREYLAEVAQWSRKHPGETLSNEQAINIAYECRETSDNIYGKMAMDNVGMNATVKSLLSGVIQFPTWNIGTVKVGTRAISGVSDLLLKAKDLIQGKEVRQLDMKDRQALQYTAGLLFTVGMVGGLMHYAFTGKKPEELADFFFPQTGETNPNGTPERVQLPSYLKDSLGITKHPWQTVSAKMAAPIHIITDLIQNRDYWGTQIFDPHDWLAGQKGLDILKYVGKSATPFVLQTYSHGAQETPGRAVASLLGVRPTPREISNTPAQNVIDEYNQLMRASTTTKESTEQKSLKADLMHMARDQDRAGFADKAHQAVEDGKITRQQVQEIIKQSEAPPSMSRFTKLPMEWALRAWEAASDQEKEGWRPYLLKKVMSEKPESLIRNRDVLVPILQAMGLDDVAAKITALAIPEKGTRFDLAGLGIEKPRPALGDMGAIDAALQKAVGEHTEKLGEPKKKTSLALPSLNRKEKKEPYKVLGF